jgi:hypothetical protein
MSAKQAADIDAYLAPWYSTPQVVALTRMDAGEIEAAVARHEMVGIRFNDGQLYFPARQFHGSRMIEGLPQVLATLAAAIDDHETAAVWLTGPYRSSIDDTELPSMWDALAAGHLDDVTMQAARDGRAWTS